MTVSVTRRPAHTLVAVSGAFFGGRDGAALADALTALRAEGRVRVVVDLTAATHLDSAAIGVLIEGATALRALGGELVLVGAGVGLPAAPLFTRLLAHVFALHVAEADAVDGFADADDARRALASAALAA